jgi:UDP-N-acetylglucosamine--N-acetylmuramyl-(pentapeptide) pyrophosphoryl-undecaprenol N-acetylglucosamine transferase
LAESTSAVKALFTGGGTAGHVTPNLALMERLVGSGCDVVYVGSPGGIERDIVSAAGHRFVGVQSGKLRRYFSLRNAVDPFRLVVGLIQALFVCVAERPDVVFSKGGYVAVPVVYAAWLLRIPVIAHESDVTPGLANRLTFRCCRYLCLNWSQSQEYLPEGFSRDRIVVTGSPVRRAISEADPVRARQRFHLDERPLLLVFGGSLGARTINESVRESLPRLLGSFQVLHVVGAGNLVDVADLNALFSPDVSPGLSPDLSTDRATDLRDYQQHEYLDEGFGDALAAADVVLCRAGANSIYELLVTRTPHLLVPLPARASRGDQLVNARTFTELGYSRVLDESDLTSRALTDALTAVFHARDEIKSAMAAFAVPESVTVITGLMREVAGWHTDI